MAETTFTPFVYCTFLCLLVVLLKLKSLLSRHDSGNLRLPPGPWPLPVIGNMHCLLRAVPHHAMHRLAQSFGSVMLLRLGQVRTVVISSSEAAREVMKTHDAVYANRPNYVTMDIFTYGGQDISFAPYGSKHWKELRRLCATELLRPKRILSYCPIREEEAARLIAAVLVSSSPASVNITEMIKATMNDVLMRCAIGDTCPLRDEYIEALDRVIKILAGFNLIDLFPGSRLARMIGSGSFKAAMELHDKMDRIMQAIIQDHATKSDDHRAEDILDILLQLQREGGLGITLTREVLSGVLFDIFSAGSETTATTTIWAMSELVRNPSLMEKAQAEIRQVLRGKSTLKEADSQGRLPFLQMVIKETLRMHPPAPLLLPRNPSELTNVMGYDIPKGTTVFVNAWAIGRDEKSWPQPDEFRPERFKDEIIDFSGADFRFLPGGAGRRMCPGLTFGLSNIEIALASLLYHFNWKLPGGADPRKLDMAEAYGITTQRKSDLLLEAIAFVPHGSLSKYLHT